MPGIQKDFMNFTMKTFSAGIATGFVRLEKQAMGKRQ